MTDDEPIRFRAKRETDGETVFSVNIKRRHVALILAMLAGPGGFATWKAFRADETAGRADEKASTVAVQADQADEKAATAAERAAKADTAADVARLRAQFQERLISDHEQEIAALRTTLIEVAKRCLTPAQVRALQLDRPFRRQRQPDPQPPHEPVEDPKEVP